MTLPSSSPDSNVLTEGHPQTDAPSSPSNSMQEYYQLQQTLFKFSLALTVVIFGAVWLVYSLNLALNYLLGACVGIVYLKILAREVETISTPKQRLGSKGIALFAGMIILASQWQALHIVPVFLGFLTYKVAIIIYTLQSVFMQQE